MTARKLGLKEGGRGVGEVIKGLYEGSLWCWLELFSILTEVENIPTSR